MNTTRITVQRAAELITRDPDFRPWLVAHGLDRIWCHTLTPMNEQLTVWRADCYDHVDGVIVYTTDEGPATTSQIIETSPGKAWWLQ